MCLFRLAACITKAVLKQVLHFHQMLTGPITQLIIHPCHFQYGVDQHAAKAGLLRSWTTEVTFKKELQSVNCCHLGTCFLQDLTGALTKKIQAE